MKLKSAMAGSTMVAAICLGMSGTAHAEVVNFAPKSENFTTGDGWDVTIRLENESWNKLAPQNMAGTSRQGQATVRGVVDVTGAGETELKSAVMRVGYIIGCFANLNSVTASAAMTLGPSVGINTIGPTAGLGGNIGPTIGMSASPGEIKAYSMQEKTLASTHSFAEISGVNVNIDGCLGPAQVRSYAVLTIDSKAGKSTKEIYGDLFAI
ncbi:MspA family porin [Nocardia sp. NPDC058518]|uniref:MspA family porin n=1 Tax=Nocardia sp. NPDC058518 TaxID=3346534 RepID=UPI00365BE578